jgi:hypothetical protein
MITKKLNLLPSHTNLYFARNGAFIMLKWVQALVVISLFFGCGNKKKVIDPDKIETMADFVELFPEKKLPFMLGDSSVKKSVKDSGAIKYEVFTRFMPDSLFSKNFGKKTKPAFYPICRITADQAETYLYAKAVADNRRVIYLLILDEKQKYATGKPMMITTTDAGTSQNTGIDAKYTITTTLQYRTAKGATIYRKEAYIYNNDAAALTLILTESNDASAGSPAEMLNPLDTFPKKKKYSGDYLQDKMNLVSIRDGKNDKECLFFVHFEKDNGECKGELKAEATFVAADKAIYSEPGNPCLLTFTFKGNTVSIKEEKGCGSYRDIKCFFEGNFTKKREPKPAKETKKKSKEP